MTVCCWQPSIPIDIPLCSVRCLHVSQFQFEYMRRKEGQEIGIAVYVFMLLALFSLVFIVVAVVVAGLRCLFIALNTD